MVKSPPANAGTLVRSLVQEEPTGLRATKPVPHNYRIPCSRAQEIQILSPCAATTETHEPKSLCSTTSEAIKKRSPCTAIKRVTLNLPQLEKSPCSNGDPAEIKT